MFETTSNRDTCARKCSRFDERCNQIQPKRLQNGTRTAHGPRKAGRMLPNRFFAFEMTPKWESKKAQTDPQRTPKASIRNDLPHYWFEDPARAPVARISIYLLLICASFSLSSCLSFVDVPIRCFFMRVLARNANCQTLIASLFKHLACFSGVVYGRPRRTLAVRGSALQRPSRDAKWGPGGTPSEPTRSPKTLPEKGLQKRRPAPPWRR